MVESMGQREPSLQTDQKRTEPGVCERLQPGHRVRLREYVLLLNNDVVVTKDWLSGLLETLTSAPDVGIVGPMTDNINGRQRIPFEELPQLTSIDAYAAEFRSTNRNRRVPAPGVIGFCILFRRALVEQIGGIDERFEVGGFEDDDFCLRARLCRISECHRRRRIHSSLREQGLCWKPNRRRCGLPGKLQAFFREMAPRGAGG